ncbi:DIAP2-like protein, partial [Mya arenaria]
MDGKTYSVEKTRIPVVGRLFGNKKMLPNETCKKADRHTKNNNWTLDIENSGSGSENENKFAKAGFYYASNKDEVICYCCAKRISNWKPDDDPYEAHKRITPNCSFIVNNGEVNVPVSTDMSSNSNDVLQKIITDLDKNNNVWRFDPENSGGESENDIATDGDEETEDQNNGTAFVNENFFNKTAFDPKRNCNVVDSVNRRSSRTRTRRQRQQSSTPTDNPGTAERTQRSNETLAPNMQTTVSTRTARNRIGHHMQTPKHPKYSTISSRIASFNQCSEIHVMPRTLAEAGFYYAGIGDCTRCFWCGIGLRHWTREDDPWTEHARFSLDCNHVLINKGQEFINLVKLALDLTEEKDETPQAQTSETPAENQETEIPKNDVEDLMTSDAAQSVRDMGYNNDIIRIAIREIMSSKGSEKLNGMNIMEEIFRIEDEPVNNKIDSTKASPTVQTKTTRSTETCTLAQKKEITTDGNKSGQETATSIQTSESKGASADVEKMTVEHRQKRRLLNENKALKESTMCSTCRKSEVCIVFLPCGHLISCEKCGNSVRTCMTCGQRVRGT